MKKELQEERDYVRILKSERQRVEEDLKNQVEQIRKKLSDSVCAVSFAETRAAVAEVFLSAHEVHLEYYFSTDFFGVKSYNLKLFLSPL